MVKYLAAIACICAFAGFSVPVCAQEIVHFQDNFEGSELDLGTEEGNWEDGNWVYGDDYEVSDNRLYMGQDGVVYSNYVNIIGAPEEMTFSGTWGGNGRALGMSIYDDNSGNQLDVYYNYNDIWTGSGFETRRFLEIYDNSNFVSIVRSLTSPEVDFALHFDSKGWSFSEGAQVWLFEENPFLAAESGSLFFDLYTTGDPDEGEDYLGYFSNLKLSSPGTVTPEPLSCALFLLGGGVLAFRRRRK